MSSQNEDHRYDKVRITNVVNGTTIEGDDEVKEYVEGEKKMLADHGASIIFQVYRLNLQADTLVDLQGERLAEIKVDGSFISPSDTVAVAKDKVRSLLEKEAGMGKQGLATAGAAVDGADQITLYLSGRPLQDDTAFYDENYIMLPVWIQVLLHRCESEEAVRLINKLQ